MYIGLQVKYVTFFVQFKKQGIVSNLHKNLSSGSHVVSCWLNRKTKWTVVSCKLLYEYA